MKAWLSKAAVQMREQIDDSFADRSRKSDGWIGNEKHQNTKSDHNPLPNTGEVCAIDVDAKLCDQPEMSIYLAEQIRVAAKTDKRISYIIHVGKIASAKSFWRFVKYRGVNPHNRHIHISFKPNQKGDFFNIPLLGGK
jgi:hypothetical protein|tara:strand:- start:133 stop:546 length:414 start_codon:yes stop_codon:yes gene_type:complete